MSAAMLTCGCAAYATDANGNPCCINHTSVIDSNPPSLNGRLARCGCNQTAPSSAKLAFFEYRGPGSREAQESCANCGYHECAHTAEGMARNVPSNRKTVVEQGKCKGFAPHGPFAFDLYYCGCRGWE